MRLAVALQRQMRHAAEPERGRPGHIAARQLRRHVVQTQARCPASSDSRRTRLATWASPSCNLVGVHLQLRLDRAEPVDRQRRGRARIHHRQRQRLRRDPAGQRLPGPGQAAHSARIAPATRVKLCSSTRPGVTVTCADQRERAIAQPCLGSRQPEHLQQPRRTRVVHVTGPDHRRAGRFSTGCASTRRSPRSSVPFAASASGGPETSSSKLAGPRSTPGRSRPTQAVPSRARSSVVVPRPPAGLPRRGRPRRACRMR